MSSNLIGTLVVIIILFSIFTFLPIDGVSNNEGRPRRVTLEEIKTITQNICKEKNMVVMVGAWGHYICVPGEYVTAEEWNKELETIRGKK